MASTKDSLRRRASRIRRSIKKVANGRPRLSVHRSSKNIYAQIINEASLRLSEAGLRPDYLDLRNAENLAPASDDSTDLVVLAAAYLGTTRLIDNLEFSRT